MHYIQLLHAGSVLSMFIILSVYQLSLQVGAVGIKFHGKPWKDECNTGVGGICYENSCLCFCVTWQKELGFLSSARSFLFHICPQVFLLSLTQSQTWDLEEKELEGLKGTFQVFGPMTEEKLWNLSITSIFVHVRGRRWVCACLRKSEWGRQETATDQTARLMFQL